ncbi:MAG: alpha/beta hydrolase [Novosphingobium sp.]|nr:alpha/beta hydrolase [Novosphingobium sp.]
MAEFEDRHWTSEDGLRLHYRDYPGPAGKPPLVCLPGLTRNARDYEALATRLAGQRRVLCLDFRGRGDSDYAKDPTTYVPPVYLADLEAFLEQARIERFVPLGTSLGGLVTLLYAARHAGRLAGAVLVDIGPEVSADGISRIRGYVGQGRSFETWMHAARALQELHGPVFPDFAVADWLMMAKRTMTLGSNGRIVFDYDMKIAEPFATPDNAAPPDLWPCWRALAGRPLLVLRGENSDILSPEIAARMLREAPGAELVTVPRVGHAPTLDEPAAVAAIERLLDRAG